MLTENSLFISNKVYFIYLCLYFHCCYVTQTYISIFANNLIEFQAF